ncbi:type I methionyl aminopeptidase [Lacihabitans soyangensis]|jgi:methionyl aminopeptidase|uniref:Methionine aminopeptidase n=1 Tax=Lacihabitans soyangensis TaxID=869394 RepID=A0AAE3KVM9_9BACT|nr:type I methionyl aminopeptidase [Lacihabitans soyangensis]MCP9761425.1 type I methionyl aminopeptidase [Lacihabitans soyangensis]
MSKRVIYLKSSEEAQIIRDNGVILGKAQAEVAKLVGEGVRTKDLDKVAEEFILDNGGKPSFKNYNGFPATLCISVNDVVVHGIPSGRELKEGDIVSVDCGVYKNGYHADSAYTYMVGEVDALTKKLLIDTKQSLFEGIALVKPGNRVGDISYGIQSFTENLGYGVVRELVGHGVGKYLHEAPEVPNFGKRGNGPKLQAGMVIAIEPMITQGKRFVVQENDNWTIRTEDRKPAAHFEHTVLVTKSGYDILTTFEFIEQVLKSRNLEII